MIARAFLSLALPVLLISSASPPSVASECKKDKTVCTGESALWADWEETATGHSDEPNDAASQATQASNTKPPKLNVHVTYPNKCADGNYMPNPNFQCPDPGETYMVLWVTDDAGAQYIWKQGCFPPDVPAADEVTSDMVLRELERIGLPALTVRTNPADKTLVNLDTVFYTDPTTVTRTLTLLGQSVLVEATPTHFAWEFGDGQSASTDSPGAPYPALDITHRYADADVTMLPSVDTTYSGRFRVNGGPWTDIDGTVTIDGPATDLRVVEATPVLSGNR